MTCLSCGSSSSVVTQNYKTCTSCGLMFEYTPQYVQGYQTPFQYIRKQYYSRVKRFAKKLLEMKSNIIGENTECILEAYGKIEFCWNLCRKKTRKYFFSQKVVLFFILKELEIDVDVPLLKNKERTKQQLQRMEEILHVPGLW